MKIKITKNTPYEKLPDYVSTEVAAKLIGYSKRTINRWLNKHPNVGITVYSSSGKHLKALSKNDVKKISKGITNFKFERTPQNVTKRSNRKKAAL